MNVILAVWCCLVPYVHFLLHQLARARLHQAPREPLPRLGTGRAVSGLARNPRSGQATTASSGILASPLRCSGFYAPKSACCSAAGISQTQQKPRHAATAPARNNSGPCSSKACRGCHNAGHDQSNRSTASGGINVSDPTGQPRVRV